MLSEIAQVPSSPPPRQSDAVRVTNTFLTGSACILCLVAALLFLRFYRKTKDRLFIFFAAAFAILGINRIFFAMIDVNDEARTYLYLVRLAAFTLIIYAIIDKNLARKRTPSS
jgi:4-amino-4-deoxy-L-arabinose transferase-like glycosyltransferase